MTQDEIIEMAQECGLVGMRPHFDGIYIESLLAFAKRVEEKALAEHAMRETQRLGQEIEQDLTWIGLTDEEQRTIAYSDINCWDWGELMDAVEAKLKEKNQ